MEVIGKVKQINPVQEFSSGFRKKEIVVLTHEQYPQPILIEFTQANCELLDDIEVGDEVSVQINIRGREWINPEGKTVYFNTVQGWRIVKN